MNKVFEFLQRLFGGHAHKWEERSSNRISVEEVIADSARVIEWAREKNRRPANSAFTAGPERQAAYWIEWAESELKGTSHGR